MRPTPHSRLSYARSLARLLTTTLAVLLTTPWLSVQAAADADRVFDLTYTMRDLPNGLRIIVVPTDFPDIVSLQIPVQTGSRNEVEDGRSGFAHFFEHMMFRGTEKFSAEAYGTILKNAGADQNAYTTDDYTNYHITFTKADLEKVLEIEADRFANLRYTEEQFRTEALAVKGEYLKNYSNPVQGLYARIRDLAFDVHTYKHTTMGFLRDIEAMPDQLEYSRVFFDRWYRPEKTTIILVGDLEVEPTFALVEKYWGTWERGDYDVPVPAEPAPSGTRVGHVQWQAPTQPWLAIGFRSPAFDADAPAMPALDVIRQVYLSDSSQVYQELVLEKQLVDHLFGYFPDRKDPNLLLIGARLAKPEAAEEVRKVLFDTLVRARTELIPAEKLDATKSRLKYAFVARMDNSNAIAKILANYVHFERTPETINRLYRSYDALTPDVLRAQANTYFNDAAMVQVTLSNDAVMAHLDPIPSLDAATAAASADINLVRLPATASPLVHVSLVFSTGAASDPKGHKGIANLTAQMLTDAGSASRTITEINDALFPMAASFTAQVDKEMVRLSGSVHRDNLHAWLDIVMDQVTNPGWRESDFERIRTQTVNALKTDLIGNNDEELGKEMLYRYVYGDAHPYGAPTLGLVADLKAMTLGDVRAFYAQHFTLQNLTLGLAGGYDQELVNTISKTLTDGLPSAALAPLAALPATPTIDGHQAVIIEKETPAVAVSFGAPIDLVRGDEDWVALWLVRSWLGEHRSSNSHLYNRIREARGMNYGDYAYIEYFPRGMDQFHPDANLSRRSQLFQVWLRPLRNNNDAHFATRVAMHELSRLLEQGMDEAAFEATRNYLQKFVSLLVTTQSRQLGYAIDSQYYETTDFVTYVREGLAKLTLADVNRVIDEHLQIDNLKYVFITKDAADLKARLAGDLPSPIEYNSPKPELTAQDGLISVMPLGFEEVDLTVVPVDEVFAGGDTRR
ncbi:MAG: pitrilysin family protein [Pseudomonadota bacterium]